MIDPVIIHFAAALGIGLLIGAERERRKNARSAAGIRTFTLAALAGAAAQSIGAALLLAVAVAGTALLCAVAYYRQAGEAEDGVEDGNYGLTSEIALVLTVLLGGLCMLQPALAAGIGVTAAMLLAARTSMHVFVRQVLTEAEVRDALLFAGATLVILPLLPDRAMGPFGAFNPAKLWIVVILVMAIGGLGHIAVRALGARYGLPLAGFAGGFVSSTATIGAMGNRAKNAEARSAPVAGAVAGAVLSTVATVIQMALVLAATSLPVLQHLALPLGLAGIAAVAYGVVFTLFALRQAHETDEEPGRAFRLSGALVFAGMLAIVLFASAALQHSFGAAGVLAAAALAGFADTHAAAISVASLQIDARAAAIPILAAFTANSVSKAVFAWVGGGMAYALRVIPGLMLVTLAAWAGLLLA
ncbi:MAG: DUF4010 domain-containing protein [Ferrovibrio sp.]|uniref:MgtC/SapB family protein n=1 Tax=Ferrovibrio sp. TaxID=1917215 RepID=UPI0026086AB3|nr:DUF4010 domain-containing protein [Ferrovibrio sp.]MCW0233788.1 DUF4010 domain-containing protein [Ferrovibrio sp.]